MMLYGKVLLFCAVIPSLILYMQATSCCTQAGTCTRCTYTLCAHACPCRWCMCWSMHLNSCHLCCLSHTITVKLLEVRLQKYATCLSVVSCPHLEPVFMYKGEVSLFSFSRAKGLREGKARLHPVNNCWERGVVR